MANFPSSAALRALLAVALGVAGAAIPAAAPASAALPETTQKPTTPSTAKPTASAQKAAAQKPAVKKTTTGSTASRKSTAQKKTGRTGTANAARANPKPARTAAKPRRAVPASDEPVVAESALCYRRTAGRGRCEPQCLPYTRCRSGISSCRTGHENGPVTWFRCEQARGNTSNEPADGRVLVLGRNAHGMPTGHTLYVEKATPRGDGRYELTLSHTNYDRRCNLETNMLAEYDPASQTIEVRAGKWEQWGRDLKVAGFIHD